MLNYYYSSFLSLFNYTSSTTQAIQHEMGVGHFTPPGTKPPLPIGQEAGWAPESVWTQWQREKSPSATPAGNQALVIQSIAQEHKIISHE